MINELRLMDSQPDQWFNLPAEEKKKISPYVVNMWRYGSSNIHSIILTNESLNTYLFSVKDRRMQERLLLVGSVPQTSYKWIPVVSDKKKVSDDLVFLLTENTTMSPSQAKEYADQLTDEQKTDILHSFGYEVVKKK